MPKLTLLFARGAAALLATGALVAAGVQGAAAEPVEAQPVADGGTALTVTVVDSNVRYGITGVPRFVLVPGTCITTLIDVVAAAQVVGPQAIDIITSGGPDLPRLIQDLRGSNAIAGGPNVQLAGISNQQVNGSFNSVAPGLYALVAWCGSAINLFDPIDPNLFNYQAVVIEPSGSGSSSGGLFGS